MCMFCAAIPVAAATGVTLNGKQLQERQQAQAAAHEMPPVRPVMRLTAVVVILLMIGSVTYHSLIHLP